MPINFKVNDPDNNSTQTIKEREINEREVYRGIVLGSMFITKKGYRANKLDGLWSRFVFDSFVEDDTELYDIATTSVLFDIESTVQGGHGGSPFYIGNFSFHAVEQFEHQAKVLQDAERKNLNPALFLTPGEWKIIDDEIKRVCKYGSSAFDDVTCGDTFLSLAIRRSAFNVCCRLIRDRIDPLIVNVKDEDSIHILKGQLAKLVVRLRASKDSRLRSTLERIAQAELKEIIKNDEWIIQKLRNSVDFILLLTSEFQKRLVLIDTLKREKKLNDLRKEVRQGRLQPRYFLIALFDFILWVASLMEKFDFRLFCNKCKLGFSRGKNVEHRPRK